LGSCGHATQRLALGDVAGGVALFTWPAVLQARTRVCWVLLADPLALLLEDRIILSELRLALPGGVAIRTAG
jgi:hypothetical protein